MADGMRPKSVFGPAFERAVTVAEQHRGKLILLGNHDIQDAVERAIWRADVDEGKERGRVAGRARERVRRRRAKDRLLRRPRPRSPASPRSLVSIHTIHLSSLHHTPLSVSLNQSPEPVPAHPVIVAIP